MEAKKNPSQDVHQQSFRFFLIGLGISVSLVITAFEWTTEKVDYPDAGLDVDSPIESTIQIISIRTDTPPFTPILEKKIPTVLPQITPASITEIIEDDKTETNIVLDPNISDLNIGLTTYSEPEDDTTIFIRSEVEPKPVGGFESFYAQLSKTLNYPKKAIRNGVDGKVYVEFVVDRSGAINQLKIVKGIGAGCDEEAMRVLSMIKWEPGRQRGKPVNVRMIMPVLFKVK